MQPPRSQSRLNNIFASGCLRWWARWSGLSGIICTYGPSSLSKFYDGRHILLDCTFSFFFPPETFFVVSFSRPCAEGQAIGHSMKLHIPGAGRSTRPQTHPHEVLEAFYYPKLGGFLGLRIRIRGARCGRTGRGANAETDGHFPAACSINTKYIPTLISKRGREARIVT